MNFLDLCRSHYLVKNPDTHQAHFMEAMTQQRQSVIEVMKEDSGHYKTYFYFYLNQYCPEQYIYFLPDLIEDFVNSNHNHYINNIAKYLFSQFTPTQQCAIAYQALASDQASFELQKILIEFLYDDCAGSIETKESADSLRLTFQHCLENMQVTHQNHKIAYEIALYLTHLHSDFHAQKPMPLPAQPSLFSKSHYHGLRYPPLLARQLRFTFSLNHLISFDILDELEHVSTLAPQTALILFQFALEHDDPEVRQKAQYVLSSHRTLLPHVITVLRSSEATYKRRLLQWLTNKECQINVEKEQLIQIFKEDKSQRFSAYLYALFLKYHYDLTGYFDRETVAENAKKQLKKIPISLQWLAIDDLPPLYWHDQQPIDSSVVYGWLCQAATVSDLTQHHHFKLYLNFLDATSQQVLARFILERFIAQDLLQSAAKCKGILMFCTPLDLAEYVEKIEAYFKKAQQHVPQLKAMLEILLDPERQDAILYLLNAKAFGRKPIINEYRIEILKYITTEYGITHPCHFNQLFTPNLGFNHASQHVYFYQEQYFYLEITADLKLLLKNAQDQKISQFPKPKTDAQKIQWTQFTEDLQQTNQAFTALIKQLKSHYRKIETPYMASFKPRDWFNLFFSHPILRHIAHSVVWQANEVQFMTTTEGHFMDKNGKKIELQETTSMFISDQANKHQDWDNLWKDIFIQHNRSHLWQKTR